MNFSWWPFIFASHRLYSFAKYSFFFFLLFLLFSHNWRHTNGDTRQLCLVKKRKRERRIRKEETSYSLFLVSWMGRLCQDASHIRIHCCLLFASLPLYSLTILYSLTFTQGFLPPIHSGLFFLSFRASCAQFVLLHLVLSVRKSDMR